MERQATISDVVVPAQAGMSLSMTYVRKWDFSSPRAGGDEPASPSVEYAVAS